MDSLLESLNKDQIKAVTYEGQNLLVLAGAGSGKTRVLTSRAVWLIKEKKVPAQSILLLTFTNKAAKIGCSATSAVPAATVVQRIARKNPTK